MGHFRLWLWVCLCFPVSIVAQIHPAPTIIKATAIQEITNYPIEMYRLFRTDDKGEPTPIPFQMDEVNGYGDYVLPLGGNVTAQTGNGLFDGRDELSFMGDDVGSTVPPKVWPMGKPALVYEILIKKEGSDQKGSVFVGLYFQKPPDLSPKSYVQFNREDAQVLTSKYRYRFDKKNWLVARGVDVVRQNQFEEMFDGTTFFMKADLKYFLTVTANHESIESALEAYKTGPIRSIIRISFSYSFLKLNFELGLYTEVSFFSNAVILPAVLYNPLDGAKSLNKGSGFYYGIAMKDNPKDLLLETNMPPFSGFKIPFLSGRNPKDGHFWLSTSGRQRLLYIEIETSQDMLKHGAYPYFYKLEETGESLKAKRGTKTQELQDSSVNLALYFDMTRLTEGEHTLSFKLYFDNQSRQDLLDEFKDLKLWTHELNRVKT